MGIRRELARVAVVVCAALLLSAVMAQAATAGYKTGRYAGTTSQDEAISFKAKKLVVKNFVFAVVLDCTDGQPQRFTGTDGKVPTGENGRFQAVFSGETSTAVVTGKLKRKRAEGKIESQATPPSGASCSGSADWNAKKQ